MPIPVIERLSSPNVGRGGAFRDSGIVDIAMAKMRVVMGQLVFVNGVLTEKLGIGNGCWNEGGYV